MASHSNLPDIALKMCSFNMHGFTNGHSMVRELCKLHDIIFLQEHWLMNNNLYKIGEIDNNFRHCSVSAMNNYVSNGLLYGHPYGCVSIMWHGSLSHRIQVLFTDEQEGRYVTVKLKCTHVNIILSCIYFPCLTSTVEYTTQASNVLVHIENALLMVEKWLSHCCWRL